MKLTSQQRDGKYKKFVWNVQATVILIGQVLYKCFFLLLFAEILGLFCGLG
jgi:hypothetical protein